MVNIEKFELPPLPETLLNCMTYMYKNDFNYETLIKKITTDVGLTGKIFHLANSQLYSQGGKATDNLLQAMARIGANNLLKILTDEYYKAGFGSIKIDFFTLKDFSLHSSFVSHIAVLIAEQLKIENSNDLMIAALFHDIGHLARYVCDQKTMVDLISKCKENKCDFYTQEKNDNITPHNIIGREVAKKWNLSPRVTYLIEHHHTPEAERPDSGDIHLSRDLEILMFSDILAHRMKIGYNNYVRDTRITKYFLDRIGITSEVAAKIAKDTVKATLAFNF